MVYTTGHDTYGVPQSNTEATAQVLSVIPISRTGLALTTIEVGMTSRILLTTVSQLQKKFKHAADFGITGIYNRQRGYEFYSAINQHINAEGTQIINGTFRNASNPVIFYMNPKTGLTVVSTPGGEFITGMKLNNGQVNDILTKQFLW